MGSDLNRGSSGSTSAKNGPAFKWACGMLMFKGNSLANKSKQKKMDDISEVKKKKYQEANNEVTYNFIAACPNKDQKKIAPQY